MSSRSYHCPSVERLAEYFRDCDSDVNLQIPLERFRSRLEINVEKGLRLASGEYAKTMRGDYVCKIGDKCFTVKILVDGLI